MVYTVAIHGTGIQRTTTADDLKSAARQIVAIERENIPPRSRISVSGDRRWTSYRHTANGQLRQLATYG